MKKGLILILFVPIILSGLVSAGFWDFFSGKDSNSITGEAIDNESFGGNVEIENILGEGGIYELSNGEYLIIKEINSNDTEKYVIIEIVSEIESGANNTTLEWQDSNGNEISEIDVTIGESEIVLYFENLDYTGGELVSFQLFEKRLFSDNHFLTLQTYLVNGTSSVSLTLPINQSLVDSINKNPSDLYFITNLGSGKSDTLTLNVIEMDEPTNDTGISDELNSTEINDSEIIEEEGNETLEETSNDTEINDTEVEVETDTTPPAIFGGSPNGVISNLDYVLKVSTNEAAECRYSQNRSADYDDMFPFAVTRDNDHESPLPDLEEGSHGFYVNCIDSSGNMNALPYVIGFSFDPSREDNTQCNEGCGLNGECYPTGYVDADSFQYCSTSLGFISQRFHGSVCNNNYECISGLCEERQCSSPPSQNAIVNFFEWVSQRF